MSTWTETAVRAGGAAGKKLEKRADIYNKWNYQMQQIKEERFFRHDGYILRLKEWAKIRPLVIDFFKETNKVLPTHTTTNASIFERLHNLMETTGLQYSTLNNARIYALETLIMERKSIDFQRNVIVNLTTDKQNFVNEIGLARYQ